MKKVSGRMIKYTLASAALAFALTGCAAEALTAASETTGTSTVITEAGSYTISGTVEGQILIDASESDLIELVLDGCSVTSTDSAAIYVKNAGEVTITTTEGSVNTLTNVTGFEADGDTNVDGVIFSKSDLIVSGSGELVIESADHGIVSKDDLIIASGTITITAAGDGCQANDGLVIDGGTLDITGCTEGLEGNTVTVNGGDISIVSSDDAVNAAGDNEASVTINGGTIDITAYGDGIDSNGALYVNGGFVTISGPENSRNGSLDYTGTGSITGGTVIAAGMSGMEMNFSEASQGSILVSSGNQSSGTAVTVTDQSGNEILSFTPNTSYSCVLISSPQLLIGETYTISFGSNSQTVTLDDYLYGQAMGFEAPEGQGGLEGRTPPEGFNGEEPPELPEGFDGQMPPEPPEGFDGGTPLQMPT